MTPAPPPPLPMLLLLLLSGTAPTLTAGPLPVIMMHGVGSTHTEMQTIQTLVETLHPGTVITSLHLFEGKVASLVPLKAQVHGVIERIRTIVGANATLYRDGWHMVCKSQGGLTCACRGGRTKGSSSRTTGCRCGSSRMTI